MGVIPEKRLLIEGGRRLDGELRLQGAKNSALPILTAAFLTGGVSEIHNCPDLTDVDAAIRILRHLGCRVSRQEGVVTVDATQAADATVPDELMREMRSSIVFLGAILARCGSARVCFPGGCELGPRPVDLHLAALRRMGAVIREDHGSLDCTVPAGRLHGANIAFSFPSVGATENVMIAAATAEGRTLLTNAAREPEILDLARYLTACGARIDGAGEGVITIEGVRSLHGARHAVIGDRIAAATYLAAAAVTGGRCSLTGCDPVALASVLPIFEEMGCRLRIEGRTVALEGGGRLRAPRHIRTMPYPGFPTDAQAPFMAMSAVAEGHTVFVENIFENRYRHVSELCRMGAHIKVEGRVAVVEGVPSLQSAEVEASDLRGGAALIGAGLGADGETAVAGMHHVYRGYEDIEGMLRALGASVRTG